MANADQKHRILIIDCDPGCDDAIALLLAIRKGGYKQIIITTVAGNVPVERTTLNAQKIASVALHDHPSIPEIFIHRGLGKSMMGNAPNVMSVHGRDGLGDVPLKLYPENPKRRPVNISLSAVELLKNLQYDSKDVAYDLVCTGPLTNLATALSLSDTPQRIISRLEKIVVMGGAFKSRGNITPTAEFNFFFDPVAVKIFLDTVKKCEEDVKGSIYKKLVFVPLDITERAQLSWNEIEKAEGDDIGLWVKCMLQKYFLFHAFSAQELKDPCTSYNCAHKTIANCQFKEDGDYKLRKEDRMLGKSGKTYLRRFSYLHDPLAVYFAMNWNDDYTDDARISIHTNDDDLRGSIAIITDKVSMSEKGAYTKGTTVRYLSPNKVPVSYIADFKKALLEACRLK